MFERFCFPHKVANRLAKLGWPADKIPRRDPTFLQLCDALKLGGYDAARAAQLWHLVFSGDIEARQKSFASTLVFTEPCFWRTAANGVERRAALSLFLRSTGRRSSAPALSGWARRAC